MARLCPLKAVRGFYIGIRPLAVVHHIHPHTQRTAETSAVLCVFCVLSRIMWVKKEKPQNALFREKFSALKHLNI